MGKLWLLMIALFVAGCSGNSVDEATHDRYVEVEAQRLCDTQRQTFATEQELEESFLKAMTDSGISEEDQKTLREQREDDVDLREEINTRYLAICS